MLSAGRGFAEGLLQLQGHLQGSYALRNLSEPEEQEIMKRTVKYRLFKLAGEGEMCFISL